MFVAVLLKCPYLLIEDFSWNSGYRGLQIEASSIWLPLPLARTLKSTLTSLLFPDLFPTSSTHSRARNRAGNQVGSRARSLLFRFVCILCSSSAYAVCIVLNSGWAEAKPEAAIRLVCRGKVTHRLLESGCWLACLLAPPLYLPPSRFYKLELLLRGVENRVTAPVLG